MNAALWPRTHMNTAQNVRPVRRLLSFVLASLLYAGTLIYSGAGETNTPAAPAARTEDATNTADAFRSYLQLQEKLHAAQLALERNRREYWQVSNIGALLAQKTTRLRTWVGIIQRGTTIDFAHGG